jgi:hypothetical protein
MIGEAVNIINVRISISAEEFLRLYEGSARDVFAISEDGRSIRFPARILQPYVLHDGIHGRFRIHFDAEHKFQSIERI